MREERFCPRCGAYWQCGCLLEEWSQPVDETCRHDWLPAVGVELSEEIAGNGQAIVCRLCGLYAVGVRRE